ncbi:MAG: ParB/RepB/Spo0J family partition protein [Anaerolineales bacterium]|nr:ParB/RepB/Spo0J family partition protein [Anaerolineales bacterium]MCW5855305.1 ParB/RepB/Spo0J family partition protein [Anaerolineales bacterium]
MGEQVMVDLKLIDPNPYQMRQAEDPAAVAELAASIQRSGLLERPSARRAGDRWQLVFGHTRLAAFRLLAKQDSQYAQMPLEVVGELDDRQMFELGLAENLKRRQLNAIEVAHALKTYMEQFEATSEEAGELFGLQASTVRGKVRLLELPKPVQEKLAGGELSEGNARVLVSLLKVGFDDQELQAVLQKADSWHDGNIETSAESALRQKTILLARESEKKVRKGRWKLDLKAGGFGQFPLVEEGQFDPEVAEHLKSPPACSGCKFRVTLRRNQYCGLAACYDQKSNAWFGMLLAQASKKTGVPPYQKGDGKYAMVGYGDSWEKILEKKDFAEVRLLVNDDTWREFKGLPNNIVPVLVGGALKAAGQQYGSPYGEADRKARLRSRRKPAVKAFLRTVAGEHFADRLEGVPQQVLKDYMDEARPYDLPSTWGKSFKSEQRREMVAWYTLWRHMPEPTLDGDSYWQKIATYLEGQAKFWGFELPNDVRQAAEREHKAVAAETAAKKAKGKARKKVK